MHVGMWVIIMNSENVAPVSIYNQRDCEPDTSNPLL